MPLFGDYYDVPFEAIKEISMAGINIGPWGKDFHKLTERVNKEDLYERTPRILDAADPGAAEIEMKKDQCKDMCWPFFFECAVPGMGGRLRQLVQISTRRTS